QSAALLGRALLAQERAAEAEALSHESEALAGDDLRAAVAWRGVRAEALARRGEHAAAIEVARAAVEVAAATDRLLYPADVRAARWRPGCAGRVGAAKPPPRMRARSSSGRQRVRRCSSSARGARVRMPFPHPSSASKSHSPCAAACPRMLPLRTSRASNRP